MKAWCPPQSPLRIQFPEELLGKLEPDAERVETVGFLYGSLQGTDLKILSSSQQDGTEMVGIYALRIRGEVFLTESNLAQFEATNASAALVIAGDKAGFFVRDSDGSLQSVRSYEEFPVQYQISRRGGRQNFARWPLAAGLMVLAALPLAALEKLHAHRPPAGLTVTELGDQLVVSWKPGHLGVLRISDGAGQTSIPVLPDQSSATYVRRTGNVELALILTE